MQSQKKAWIQINYQSACGTIIQQKREQTNNKNFRVLITNGYQKEWMVLQAYAYYLVIRTKKQLSVTLNLTIQVKINNTRTYAMLNPS